jgi:hypothetical protein
MVNTNSETPPHGRARRSPPPLNLKAAMEIAAEQAEYAENAEAERIRFEAVPSLAFAQRVRRGLFPMFHENACSSVSSAFSASSVATPIAVLRLKRFK